jgi:hypothetical protein
MPLRACSWSPSRPTGRLSARLWRRCRGVNRSESRSQALQYPFRCQLLLSRLPRQGTIPDHIPCQEELPLGHVDQHRPPVAVLRPLEARQSPMEILLAKANAGLDGLVTNDKFCFSRWDILRLNWWRRPLRLRGTESQRCDTLLEEDTHPGGTNGAGMEDSQGSSAVCRRSAPLGHGLSVPSEMGNDDKAGDPACPNSTGGM